MNLNNDDILKFARENEEHRSLVETNIHVLISKLKTRGLYHDDSKLTYPELTNFARSSKYLEKLKYGSDEYKNSLRQLGIALNSHYSKNRHHPEYYSNGIAGMDLVDLIEMFCDWLAAVERHEDGDIMESIKVNKNRFGYDDILESILINTYNNYFKEREDIYE